MEGKLPPAPTVTLNNGYKMPLVGFGSYDVFDKQECIDNVTYFVKIGGQLIDTARHYGNEV